MASTKKKGSVEAIKGRKGYFRLRITLPRDPTKPMAARLPTKRWTWGPGTKQEAINECDKRANDYGKAVARGASSVTVLDALNEYYDAKARKAKVSSLQVYRYHRDHLAKSFGTFKLEELEPRTISTVLKEWMVAGVSFNYLSNRLGFLSAAYDHQIDQGVPIINPCKVVDVPVPEQSQKKRATFVDGVDITKETVKAFSEEQVATFIDYTIGHQYEVLWMLMLKTGMRIGEALALRWVDVHDGKIYVGSTQHYNQDPETLEYELYNDISTKTKKGNRWVTIDVQTQKMLKLHKTTETRRRKWSFKGEKAKQWINFPESKGAKVLARDELVFHTSRGSVVSRRNALDQLLNILRALDVLELEKPEDERVLWETGSTSHALRHTHATLSLLKDPSCLIALSKRLGHSKTSITLDVYGHCLPKEQDKIANVWEDLVSSTPAYTKNAPGSSLSLERKKG